MTTPLYTDAALQADQLCLGPHWIYDQAQLAAAYPDGVTEPTDPLSPYHPARKAGQHTHTGDQLRFLAQSIQAHGGYDLTHWRATWLAEMSHYDGYIDGATKATLATEARTASDSNEFAVVSRIAPILDLGLPVEEAVSAACSQAALTHGGAQIPEACAFFIRVVARQQAGASLSDALTAEAATDLYPTLGVADALKQAQAADPVDFRAVALQFGQACSLTAALPLTLYFVLHHAGPDLQSRNALAGGDSTARAMVLAVLTA